MSADRGLVLASERRFRGRLLSTGGRDPSLLSPPRISMVPPSYVFGESMRCLPAYVCIVTILFSACDESSHTSELTEDASVADMDAAVPSNLDQEVGASDMSSSIDVSALEEDAHTGPDAFIVTTEPLPDPIEPPSCGSEPPSANRFVDDPTLALKAHTFDRIFWALPGRIHGLNADIRLRDEDAKTQVLEFAANPSAWSLDGIVADPNRLVASDEKVAGLYAGVGIAADAFRYAVLRDTGAPCDEVTRARAMVQKTMDTLKVATEVTGIPGVMPRALAVRGVRCRRVPCHSTL